MRFADTLLTRGSLLNSLMNCFSNRYSTIITSHLLLLRDSNVGIVQLHLFAPVLDEQHPRGLRLCLRRSRLRPQVARTADGERERREGGGGGRGGGVTKHKEEQLIGQRKQLRARRVHLVFPFESFVQTICAHRRCFISTPHCNTRLVIRTRQALRCGRQTGTGTSNASAVLFRCS